MWNHVIQVRELSYGPKTLLYALASRADKAGCCYPSTSQLMSDTGTSRATVYRERAQLLADGLIIMNRGGGAHGDTTVYCLTIGTYQRRRGDCQQTCEHGSQNETVQSQNETGAQSQNETARVSNCDSSGLKMRRGSIKEEQKKYYSAMVPSQNETPVHNSVETLGWVPATKADRAAAKRCCYDLGASEEESERFVRENSIRRWAVIGPTCSVADVARLFVDRWRHEHEAAWDYERQRRRDAARNG